MLLDALPELEIDERCLQKPVKSELRIRVSSSKCTDPEGGFDSEERSSGAREGGERATTIVGGCKR